MRKYTIFGRLAFIFLSLLLTCILSVNIFSRKIVSLYATFATNFSQNLATYMINTATMELLKEKYPDDSFFIVDSSKMEIISFDVPKLNRLLVELTNNIFQSMEKVKQGYLPEDLLVAAEVERRGPIYYIPFSAVTKNVFLNAFGPKIPIRLSLLGSVKGEIKSEIHDYGLNNAFVQLDILVTLGINVIVPFENDKVTTSVRIPLIIQAIQGDIPNILWGTNVVDTVFSNIGEGVMV